MTMTSTGALVGSRFNPSCCWNGVYEFSRLGQLSVLQPVGQSSFAATPPSTNFLLQSVQQFGRDPFPNLSRLVDNFRGLVIMPALSVES